MKNRKGIEVIIFQQDLRKLQQYDLKGHLICSWRTNSAREPLEMFEINETNRISKISIKFFLTYYITELHRNLWKKVSSIEFRQLDIFHIELVCFFLVLFILNSCNNNNLANNSQHEFRFVTVVQFISFS